MAKSPIIKPTAPTTLTSWVVSIRPDVGNLNCVATAATGEEAARSAATILLIARRVPEPMHSAEFVVGTVPPAPDAQVPVFVKRGPGRRPKPTDE